MARSAFKMKGFPAHSVASPLAKATDPVTQGGVKPTVDVSGGSKTERHSDKFKRVKRETSKGNDETRTAKFAKEYGGTWTKQGNVYRNQDGQTVKQAAVAQGKKKSQEKRDYIAKNSTKKSGAPMKQDTGFGRVPSTIQKGSKKTSYSEAYKNANKEKYPTLKSFIDAAKKYNKSNPKKSNKTDSGFSGTTIKPKSNKTDEGFGFKGM